MPSPVTAPVTIPQGLAPPSVLNPAAALAPVAALAPALRTATGPTGTRPGRKAGGMLPKGKKPDVGKMMKFTPINIRDPLNLKRFG